MNRLIVAVCMTFFGSSLCWSDQTNPALDALFDRLHETNSIHEASDITNRIWSIWRHYDDEDIADLMKTGVRHLQAHRLDQAIASFSDAIDLAPDFAEAWNARATAYYMAGEYELSTADVRQTLALEPRHFGALSGQGLIYLQQRNLAAALVYMKKALRQNPHLQDAQQSIEVIQSQLQKEVI